MKWQGLAAIAGLIAAPALAQQGQPPPVPVAMPAPPEPGALPLYPDQRGTTAGESWAKFFGDDLVVRNVTRATLTPVLPDPAKANGSAVLVVPGGAFMMLAMEHEGWRVARALADRGIAAFVLKYRLLPTPADNLAARQYMFDRVARDVADPRHALVEESHSTADALAALALIRARAAAWRVDPRRVGMIGFSAGAMTALATVQKAPPGQGPAFVGYVYGPQVHAPVPAGAPPLFDAIALDDPLFAWSGFAIAQDWQAAKAPVEIHGYERGSHGFGGLGREGTTTTLLLDEFTGWMRMHGWLAPGAGR